MRSCKLQPNMRQCAPVLSQGRLECIAHAANTDTTPRVAASAAATATANDVIGHQHSELQRGCHVAQQPRRLCNKQAAWRV